MQRRWCFWSLLVTAPLALAQMPDATEPLLARVPADAALVVVIPSVEKLLAGAAAFGQGIGAEDLAKLNPRALLEKLDDATALDGLDIDGPCTWAQVPNQAGPVILCRLKDADAWKQASHARELEDGLLAVRFLGESNYAAIRNDVLVLAEEREIVQGALAADGKFAARFRAAAGTHLAKCQVVAYADLTAWRPVVDGALTALGMYLQMSTAMSCPAEESSGQLSRWAVGELGKLLREVGACTGGLRVDADGVFAEGTASFRPDGSVAGYLKNVRRTERALLRGLLDQDPFLVLACEWEVPRGTKSLNTRLLEGLLASDAIKDRIGAAAFEKAMKASAAAHDAMTGFNVVLSASPRGEGVLISGLYFTDSPKTVTESMAEVYRISPEFANPFGAGPKVEITTRTERIDGTDVQAFDMVFQTEDEQLKRLLQTVYGKITTVYSAARDADVVYATGATEPARAQLAKLLAGQGGQLAENRRAIAAGKTLSPNPQVFVVIDVLRLVEFALGIARSTGAPVPPLELGEKTASHVVCGAYLEPERIRVELFVPAEPVRVLRECARAAKKSAGKD